MKKEVTIWGKLGFSGFIGGEKLLYVLVSSYATIFYISKLHLNPIFVVLLIFVTRMFDAINDPIIGAIIDRSSKKLKRFISLAVFLLPLLTFLIFTVPNINTVFTYLYVIITYILWSVMYTVSEVSIYSVVMRMTKFKDEQNYILSISQVGSMIGVFLGLFIIAFYLRNGIDNIAWVNFSISFSILGFVLMVLALLFVKEKYNFKANDNNITLKSMLKTTFTNKNLITIMFIYMSQMFMNASNVIGVYVFDGYFHHTAAGNIVGMFTMIIIIPLAFSLASIIKKVGKTNIMFFASFLMIFTNLLALTLTDLSGFLFLLLMLSQIGILLPSLLRPLYAQECINYELKKKGHVNESSYFSIMTFFNKAGDALGASLGTLLLVFAGFNEAMPVSEQSIHTINMLHAFYFFGPILMGLSWFIGLKYFYKLAKPKKFNLELQNPIKEMI